MTDSPFEPAPSAEGAEVAEGKLDRLLATLPPDLRPKLESICQRRSVRAGEVLVEEGEDSLVIGYVLSGMLGMVKLLPDGRRHIIGLLVPTDMYGRLFNGKFSYQIDALSDAELVVCSRPAFEALLEQAPVAERLFMVDMFDELDAAREWILVLGGPKVVQRVASFLLILCRRKMRGAIPADTDDDPINLRLAIRRPDLAQYLGARPESLSRAFHQLERDGLLRMNSPHDFDILDVPGLIDVAGHDLVIEESAARG
ncbi:Crp/Fnr family transcriptional regulator [Solirhodobacter olei]|uniref:Crp/Fnr family transcriptional regulator n=1 Tax=Solirhodobacter olei TaxID=2493082 RepID=UPI0013E323DA|nr:Crp/Fnr family transcriptional regulator [Solirhodobacter olei]